MFWVDYEALQKNFKTLKINMLVFLIIFKEYKNAKKRIEYAPGGNGYMDAKNEFETLINSIKKK